MNNIKTLECQEKLSSHKKDSYLAQELVVLVLNGETMVKVAIELVD